MSMDTFFPKCFTIVKMQGDTTTGMVNDILEFTEEYRFVYSMSILKKFLKVAQEPNEHWNYLVPQILVSLNICEKRLLTIDD